MTALNIAYDEKETRGFIRLNILTLAITVGAVLIANAATVAIAALGHLETGWPHAPGTVLSLSKLISYIVLGSAGAGAAATLYRYAPDRDEAQWTWLTPGSVGVTSLWLALTLGFGAYVANFGSYDATYGSLGAVVVLLTWLYLSAYILIMGAELNAELEHQIAADTTTGPARPLGARGAEAADTVADDAPRPSVDAAEDTASVDEPASGTAHRDTPPGSSGSPARELAVVRAAARAVSLAGMPRLGLAPALVATAGLALVRRPARGATGAALVAAATLLAWPQRA